VYAADGQYLFTLEGSRNDLTYWNDLKGLAVSPDDQRIVAVFHTITDGKNVNWLYYYWATNRTRAADGARRLMERLNRPGFYHYIAWKPSAGGSEILLSSDPRAVQERHAPPAEDRRQEFIDHCGVNLPWLDYGSDVGRDPAGGPPKGFAAQRQRLRADLTYLAAKGVKLVRVFVFGDLRTGMDFHPVANWPTGLDPYAMADFRALVEECQQAGLRLVPVLLDYQIADGVGGAPGAAEGEHPNLIWDSSATTNLCEALQPLVDAFADDPTVYAWDIINEPERITGVTDNDLLNFMIHMRVWMRGRRCTVGHSEVGMLDAWRLGEDVYTFCDRGAAYDTPAPNIGWRPVLIGLSPPVDVARKLAAAYRNGYEGILFWSLNDGDFRPNADAYSAWVGGP